MTSPIIQQEKKAPHKKVLSPTLIYGVWAASTIATTLVFVFQFLYPAWIGPFSNIIAPIAAGSAFVSSIGCVRKYGLSIRGRFDRIWIYFTLGMACWTLAETTWSIYYFFLDVEVPYPSVADFFYIGAYIPLSLALLGYFSTFRAAFTAKKLLAAGSTIIVGAALIVSIVLPLELVQVEPVLTMISDLIYPILDLILFSLAILSVSLFMKGTLGKWWAVLAMGITLDIIGDETFLYQAAQGTYYNGSFSDLFYIAAYFMFALAFYVHRRQF